MLMLRVIGAGGIALVTHMLFLSLDFIASVCQKSLVGQDIDMLNNLGVFSYIHTRTF